MKKAQVLHTPEVNVHIHLFTADHCPPIQFYYLIRGQFAERYLGSLSRVDIVHKTFFWIVLGVLTAACFLIRPLGRKVVRGFVRLITTTSLVRFEDLKAIFGAKRRNLSAFHVLRYIVVNVRRLRRYSETPFNGVLSDFVNEIYRRHRKRRNEGESISQEKMFRAYAEPLKDRTEFRHAVALTLNFDSAFRHVFDPSNAVEPRLDLAQQAEELLALANGTLPEKTGIQILPFLCVDPRKYDKDGKVIGDGGAPTFLTEVRGCLNRGFRGLKIYPPLGYLPEDVRLEPIFDHCAEHGIPVLTHAGIGGAGRKGALNCSELAHPYYWIPVLERLKRKYGNRDESGQGPGAGGKKPRFKLCLAHMGGSGPIRSKTKDWWDEVINLMDMYEANGELIRIYTDTAYNLPTRRRAAKRYFRTVDELFGPESGRHDRILFGCDWWMYLIDCDAPRYYHYLFERWLGKSYYPFGKKFADVLGRNGKGFLDNVFDAHP